MKTFKFRRIPRAGIIAFVVLLVFLVVIYVAVGWYFSGKLFELKPQKLEFDQTILNVDNDRYVMQGTAYDIDGIISGIRPDGSAVGVFSKPTGKQDDNKISERTLTEPLGQPPKVGDKISLQGNMWVSNPKDALGVDFNDVQYESSVGKLDAWLIPVQNSKSWTIGIHGIGGNKNEMLRFVKPVLAAGNTMMIINYRGDVGNPSSSDGRNHFGDEEWQDVEAAVRYAKAHGATDIQLYGSSLGGSLTQNYLRRSSDVKTTNITKVVLDSPALDWNEILNFRVKKMGYPTVVAKPGKTFAKLRAGIDFGRIITKPGSMAHKTLIIHNQDDTSVPQAASKRIAEAQPDLVTFQDFGSGGHIRAWNHDPAKYEALVTRFLKE